MYQNISEEEKDKKYEQVWEQYRDLSEEENKTKRQYGHE